MARSQLPCPLFLLCSLLLLSSVLLQELEGKPGGVFPVDVTNKGVQEAAAFAVEIYNEDSGNANYFKELNIVKATAQVVEGMKYHIIVEVGKTVCEKSNGPMPISEIQNCELTPEYEKLTCSFQVWSRPWLKERKMELVSSSCF